MAVVPEAMIRMPIRRAAPVSARRVALALAAALLCGPPARAADPPPPGAETSETRQREIEAAWQQARHDAVRGPRDIALAGVAHLHLPAGMVFVPSDAAGRLLRSWGNRVTENPLGLVLGTRNEDRWVDELRFVHDGYIKDDDARHWNADEMLTSIREGNDAANEERRSRGFPETEIIGWVAPPAYDPATHRLVSSLAQRDKGAPADAVQGVNYLTYLLGREGYLSAELLTNQTDFAADRAASAPAIDALGFDAGHRYTDFEPSTDHVAAYGLAALVGVVAAKKLGLLALAGVFALKFAKLGAIGMAFIGGLFARLFRRRPTV